MFTAYVVVTLLTIAVSAIFATVDFLRRPFVLGNMARLGLSESWLPVLGSLKAAGAVGLLLGLLGVPLIGTAAAIGLVLFFVGAIVTHLRAHDHALGFPGACLLLALAALALGLAA